MLTFAYNPAGQIVTRNSSNDSYASNTALAVDRTYAVNGLNQYTGTTSGGTPSATFTYDANGNLTSDGAHAYVYDAENRLVSATGGHTATLAYDPLGRLWQVSAPSGTTRFLYDGDRLVVEYDGTNSLLRAYDHGAGPDEPLVWYEVVPGGVSRRYLHADHQGSIVAVADQSGNPIAINAYDEWGIPNSGNQGRFGYTGQTWLPELGMWYYKARIYSPTLGRFLQTDPVGYQGGINLYDYVDDDPINHTDSTGLCPPITSRICAEKERELRQARDEGIRKAWAAERKLVSQGGGTRNWTVAERSELLKTGRVRGYEGHHINTVKGNSIDLARDPNNIRFVTRTEHIEIHRQAGGLRATIRGLGLIDRALGVLGDVDILTGVLSGRLRADNLDNFISDMFGYESRQDHIRWERKVCGKSNWQPGDPECV